MTEQQRYRWPTKIKKFGIEDPFLKFLIAKYENEIPWQNGINSTDRLSRHVQDVMLPRLLDRVRYPSDETTRNHFFVTVHDVDFHAVLRAEHTLDDPEIEAIETIYIEEDEIAAAKVLVKLINERKHRAFKSWVDILTKNYPQEHAFWLLILRPLFESSGRGTRRSVIEPSLDVIDWLRRRIERERLSPNQNLANQYCLKLGAGSHKTPIHGWQYVPSGRHNARQLAAACRGSGWCVAAPTCAAGYLEQSEFYILRHQNRPVVALRVSRDGHDVQECQGQWNDNPDEWFPDILLFLRTMGLKLWHRESEMVHAMRLAGDLGQKPTSWWRDRITLWPFAAALAPSEIRHDLAADTRIGALQYVQFRGFHALAPRVGLHLDLEFWVQLIQTDPSRYADCPQEMQEMPTLREACIAAWIECLEEDEVTATGLQSVPDLVMTDAHFQDALKKHLPSSFRDAIRKYPSTWKERAKRLVMQDVLPVTPDEPAQLALERLVNVLLVNEDGNFSDEKFPEAIRSREDFLVLREQAWLDAIQAQPPLWFATPDDLRNRGNFQPLDERPPKINLDNWGEKVLEKPWLLTQKDGVPKSIRFHRKILDAYRDGWLPYLERSPWRVWVKRGGCRRVYMSYGLLAEARVIGALVDGWQSAESRIADRWFSLASERMRELTVSQLSVLRAIRPSRSRWNSGGAGLLKVCLDISNRRKKALARQRPHTPFDEEIQSHLIRGGIC